MRKYLNIFSHPVYCSRSVIYQPIEWVNVLLNVKERVNQHSLLFYIIDYVFLKETPTLVCYYCLILTPKHETTAECYHFKECVIGSNYKGYLFGFLNFARKLRFFLYIYTQLHNITFPIEKATVSSKKLFFTKIGSKNQTENMHNFVLLFSTDLPFF